jgi:hypothetical protein
MAAAVYLTVDRRDCDGRLQLSIGTDDGGYRIAGPKYNGAGKTLLRHKITERDANEIRSYLKSVSPNQTKSE